MDIRKLQRAIVDGLEDVKAQNIQVFNTEHLSPLFERVIIASGTSNRQTKALASSVRETVKGRGMQVMRCEGEDNGEWIIVDCGAAVVHVMQPAIREYYHLEEIWGGKPVKLKLGDGEVRLVKASEPMDDDEDEAPAKSKKASKAVKAPAKKAAPSKPASKVTGTKAPAAKSPAKKAAPAAKKPSPAGKKAAPAKKAATRTVGTKAAKPVKTITVGAAKKSAPAKKAAIAKPVARKAAAKPAARPAAKKAAPAKKTAR
ncbi:ribosome silencing factor [Pelomonas sp. SE-A7]|uniref:ribosome silencing factor n=1 Tax=Pelomonas sp. SE-A7 TaxID=3054953 RepID=UPI00259D2FDD|nr:ribosome silencing factor [Pelomonas sp. SE-A7]MDM4765890.1 ribosome silencing factor [Pelomonas sp. SE-A7]